MKQMSSSPGLWLSNGLGNNSSCRSLTSEDAGEHELKGVPDRWHLYRVVT